MKQHKVYTSAELVEHYDYRHFGGSGGRYVFQKDCAALESLLATSRGLLLDIPCGTGVYSRAFETKGHEVIAADASMSMLARTSQGQGNIPKVLCDVNRLPFKSGAFDTIMVIRLFQHFSRAEVVQALRELKRATQPNGRIVFDTLRWSPRRMRFFKSEIHVYSPLEVEKMLEEAGLVKVKAISLYLFSSILYRKLPTWFLRGLDWVEKFLPQRWLLRTFWACAVP